MKRILLVGFYLVAFSNAALAQLKIPSGSISVKISSAEIPSDWKTDSGLPDARDQNAPVAPVRFVSSQQDGVVYQRLEFKNGTTEEVWHFDSWLGWKDSKGDLFLFDASKSTEEGPTQFFFRSRIPPGLEWIKPQFLIPAPKTGKDVSLDYYATEAAPSLNASPVPARAWIDSVTKTPKAAQVGKLLLSYQFGDPLLIPALPAELAEQARSRKKVQDFMQTMRQNRSSK